MWLERGGLCARVGASSVLRACHACLPCNTHLIDPRPCRCATTTLDGHWDRPESLTELERIWVTPHPECQIKVTVLDATNAPDQGHKVKLLAAMVVEGGEDVLMTGTNVDILGRD